MIPFIGTIPFLSLRIHLVRKISWEKLEVAFRLNNLKILHRNRKLQRNEIERLIVVDKRLLRQLNLVFSRHLQLNGPTVCDPSKCSRWVTRICHDISRKSLTVDREELKGCEGLGRSREGGRPGADRD